MTRPHLLAAFAITLLSGLLLVGVGALNAWYQEDWGEVTECRQDYWHCSAVQRARPRQGGPDVEFRSDAKACDEIDAYDTAVRRAELECTMSPDARATTCRLVDFDCGIPEQQKRSS